MKVFFIFSMFFPVFLWSDHRSSYELFESFYTEGATPSFEEITGWWSGRCFKKEAPNKPLAFLLIAAEVEGLPHMAVASHIEENEIQNRYDELSNADRASFQIFMRSPEFISSEVSTRDNAIYSHIGLGVQAIKKYGGVFVGILIHSTDKEYDYRCQFFKKVK